MIVELETAKKRVQLYAMLKKEDRDDTHSVRYVIWAIHSGRIPSARVFVDQWPSFSHACCIFNSNLYSKGTDRDFIALASADENGSSFVEFFLDLAKERRWKERQGAIFGYISTTLAGIVAKLLLRSPSDGRIDLVEPYRNLVTKGPYDLSEVQKELQRLVEKLPVGWTVGSLREEDAAEAANRWTHSIPEKEDYFKWLVKTFPSACVRDQHGRPMGWQQMMSYVTSGAAFVQPEHRGLNINGVSATAVIAENIKIFPGERFAAARDTNSATLNSIDKLPWKYQPTDCMITWLIYHPPARNGGIVQQSKL